ncbi:UspA domain-containing protein [Methanoplanus limicola DSM 2279]|uniref:UspA domain-containing protein n=2 Tax=Methanoplanus limicola TaxID=2315 RepID=H1YY99_9EURY|nr:UspA domain-containing protein [Methanoplanus limicola DSM 2279]
MVIYQIKSISSYYSSLVSVMFRRILFPTDFSESSFRAFDCVKSFRKAGTEEVIILHVLDEYEVDLVKTGIGWINSEKMAEYDSAIESKMKENARQKAEGMKNTLLESGINARIIIVKGVVDKEILSCAQRERASVIVMGRHSSDNLKEIILGTTSERVLKQARMPVLMINEDLTSGCDLE